MALLGRRETRDLLARHGLHPRIERGQHFLVDPNTIRKILALASVKAGEQVLEVGAGIGALTIGLAESGARVVAIELDRALAPALDEVLGGADAKAGPVAIAWADALRADYDSLLGSRKTRMVANLPYNIATSLLMHLLEERPQVTEMIVMIQREVGERLVAAPGSDAYGGVSAKIAYLADARIAFPISRRVFLPEPDVDSVVVRLQRRSKPPVAGERERIFAVIDAGFAVRRKTIRNALRSSGLDAGVVETALSAAGVEGRVRAEELGLREFAAIAAELRVPPRRRGR